MASLVRRDRNPPRVLQFCLIASVSADPWRTVGAFRRRGRHLQFDDPRAGGKRPVPPIRNAILECSVLHLSRRIEFRGSFRMQRGTSSLISSTLTAQAGPTRCTPKGHNATRVRWLRPSRFSRCCCSPLTVSSTSSPRCRRHGRTRRSSTCGRKARSWSRHPLDTAPRVRPNRVTRGLAVRSAHEFRAGRDGGGERACGRGDGPAGRAVPCHGRRQRQRLALGGREPMPGAAEFAPLPIAAENRSHWGVPGHGRLRPPPPGPPPALQCHAEGSYKCYDERCADDTGKAHVNCGADLCWPTVSNATPLQPAARGQQQTRGGGRAL